MKNHITRMALVTGASSGIGAAFASQLASTGYDLILIARRKERLTSLASELEQHFHIKAEVLVEDLSNSIDVERIEMRLAELGALDILINNAGFGIPGKFAEIQPDRHLAMIQVHIIASVRLSRAVLPGNGCQGSRNDHQHLINWRLFPKTRRCDLLCY
jgi:short-subunit dehydrogenase